MVNRSFVFTGAGEGTYDDGPLTSYPCHVAVEQYTIWKWRVAIVQQRDGRVINILLSGIMMFSCGKSHCI